MMTKTLSRRQPAPGKHAPQRTCVVCRQVKDKKELVRLVHTPEGTIEIDATGKKKGRGAYLCCDLACWEKVRKGKQLERALRREVTGEDREEITSQARDLLKGASQ